MDLLSRVGSKTGTRGGRDQFKWSDVAADPEAEKYLGQSTKIARGRNSTALPNWWHDGAVSGSDAAVTAAASGLAPHILRRRRLGVTESTVLRDSGAVSASAVLEAERQRQREIEEDMMRAELGLPPKTRAVEEEPAYGVKLLSQQGKEGTSTDGERQHDHSSVSSDDMGETGELLRRKRRRVGLERDEKEDRPHPRHRHHHRSKSRHERDRRHHARNHESRSRRRHDSSSSDGSPSRKRREQRTSDSYDKRGRSHSARSSRLDPDSRVRSISRSRHRSRSSSPRHHDPRRRR